ncbi:creatinase-like [Glandiceps talaboti]
MLRRVISLAGRSRTRLMPIWTRSASPAIPVQSIQRWQHSFNKDMPRVVELKNGTKVKGTFSEKEMERRVNCLRKYMEDNRIEASVLTSYHNINYYSDFLYCAFGRHYGLVITMDKSIFISNNVDGGQPWRRTHGDNIAYTDWHKDNFFFAIGEVLKDYKGKIGVEYDHIALENFKKLEKVLPAQPLVDVGEPTMQMRMIKSEEEIELIKQGARIGDMGGWACVETLGEGVSEYEVSFKATEVMVREIAKTYPHAELRDTYVSTQTGVNTDGAHNPPTSRRLNKGDILIMNCFPVIAGYFMSLERTMFIEHVTSERHLELWNVNCEVHRRGLELIRPGARCDEIAAELNEIYDKYGVKKFRTFGYGHSFGVLNHYYGREAGLEFREDVDTVLKPGMVVSMEPMIMIPQGMEGAGGYRENDMLVVTEDGAENITKFPFGPEHNILKK